jgi:hypothetical protein
MLMRRVSVFIALREPTEAITARSNPQKNPRPALAGRIASPTPEVVTDVSRRFELVGQTAKGIDALHIALQLVKDSDFLCLPPDGGAHPVGIPHM